MSIDITDYPELSKALVDAINVPSDQLQRFNTAKISQFDRDFLLDAFKIDADEGEMMALLIDGNVYEEIIAGSKHKIAADISVNRCYMERIYDIAQEMGPILEQIELDSFEAGE